MKIGELFSDNKNVATVRVMASGHGIAMSKRDVERLESLLSRNANFFVLISKRHGITITELIERSDLLCKVIAGAVRRGPVLFFHGGHWKEITRHGLSKFTKFYAPKKAYEPDDRVRIEPKERTIFEECQATRPTHKPQRHGFIRTYTANLSMERLSM